MNRAILKSKFLRIPFIISLVFLSACYVHVRYESNDQKNIRKGVEEVFAKMGTINFSDFSENFDDDVKKRFERIKEYISNNKFEVSSRTNYLNKIIFENKIVKKGNTVVDLGSGWGFECLLLRQVIVGDKGKVIGVDIDETSNIVARKYGEHLGFDNVDFIFGDIREVPLADNIADVVISNYTLTLILKEDKEKVFSEIYRILKDGGSCYIGDAIIYGKNYDLLDKINNNTLYDYYYMSRSIREKEYLAILKRIGFKNIKIKIYAYTGISDYDTGRLFTVRRLLDRFYYRDKIVAADVYIYAEK